MCSPTIAMTAIMAVASAGQAYMSNQAQNRMAEAQAENANKAASFKYSQLAAQRGEVDEAAAQDKMQRQLQTQRELGTVMVAQGESGVGGNSALRVMNNAMMQGSYDMSVIEANRMSKARQITSEMDAAYMNAEAQVREAQASSVDPSIGAMNIGLAAASGAAEGYSMGKSFSGKTMGTTGTTETSLQKYKRTGIH